MRRLTSLFLALCLTVAFGSLASAQVTITPAPFINGAGVAQGPILIPVATPTSTTNELYNVGGTLYFNGSALSAGTSYWSRNAGTSTLTPASAGDSVALGDNLTVDSTAAKGILFNRSSVNYGSITTANNDITLGLLNGANLAVTGGVFGISGPTLSWRAATSGNTSLQVAANYVMVDTAVVALSNVGLGSGLLVVADTTEGPTAVFLLTGGYPPALLVGSTSLATVTKDTASHFNVYYDGGYKLQNLRGTSISFNVFYLGA